jgi:hypothetical protein
MTSWVYIFSKFTAEALLFEALVIFLLCSGYAAYWVLQKRKSGAVTTEIPASVVRSYLNALIVDAEQLRAQLFGLLAAAGTQHQTAFNTMNVMATRTLQPEPIVPVVNQSVVTDHETKKQLGALEAKLAEQSHAMASILADKTKLEQELVDARHANTETSTTAGTNGAEFNELQNKINSLENKLAEYSVIEDDLANLKRLQQENAQLKAALSGKGTVASVAATSAQAPTKPDHEEPAPTTTETAPASDPNFEELVNHVEQSLQPEEAKPEPAAAPAAAPATEKASAEGAKSEDAKSDEDLVAEFEKMING